MTRTRHWSEYATCSCGATFRVGSAKEAKHRHNFPLLCRRGPVQRGRVVTTGPNMQTVEKGSDMERHLRMIYQPGDLTTDKEPDDER